MSKLATLLLCAFATTTVLAAPTSNSTDSTDPNVDAVCFDPPDRGHDVSQAIGTCTSLFKDFLKNFQGHENSTYLWTSNNTQWKEPNVQHLPWLERRIDTNRTHGCIFDIIDLTFIGDKYPPSNVVAHGSKVLDKCFKNDQCGAIVLGPSYTTRLTVCATIHSDQGPNQGVMQGTAGCNFAAEKPQCEDPRFQNVQTAS